MKNRNNIGKLKKHVIEQAKYNDFYKILVYISTIDKLRQPTRIIDSIELSANICKVMLIYNNL